MLAIPAAPVTPHLAAVERVIVNYLRDHRFTVPDRLTATVVPLAHIASGPLVGAIPAAEALPGTIAVAPDVAKWPTPDLATALLHETLHETPTGGAFGYAALTADQQLAVEQATETMTRDLLPGLMRRMGYAPASAVPWAYAGLVKRERVASAAACHCGWTTAPARAWRARFFLTPPAERELLR